MANTLDPILYGKHVPGVQYPITGADMVWPDIPATEFLKAKAFIIEQAALWMERLDVDLKITPDNANIYLAVRHRTTPTPAQIRSLKGEAGALMVVTSWGGP